jgi:phosphotransferase system enzyme I (PtsI)
LLANIGSTSDVTAALDCGAEGVGLYRTELCFLDRTEAPSVAEQVSIYRGVFARLAGRRVVVRTLDAGSDKALPFLSHPEEPNPALGVRGFRTTVSHPQLLDHQLKAIKEAAAAESAEVWVMAPMISTAAEVRSFAKAARVADLPIIGVMIETPAAALQAELILAEVDFISIGTNDLAQYAFAADRQVGALSGLQDPWQPALLDLVALTAEGAGDKTCGVCGEAAGDPALACVLVGLGVTSLSMSPPALPAVRAALAAHTRDQCRRAAAAARTARGAADAREKARAELPGLSALGL